MFFNEKKMHIKECMYIIIIITATFVSVNTV